MKYSTTLNKTLMLTTCTRNRLLRDSTEMSKMELKFKHFVILNAADVVTTYAGLTYMGLTEINPVANTMFMKLGLIEALIAMKIVGLMVIWLVAKIYPLKVRNLAITIACLIFILVVANNIYHMANAL